LVISTVQQLRRHLQWAIEVEHSTLPPYLCALYSIHQGANRPAYEVIHSVFMEEMLHLTMAANLLNAVGGSPKLDAPHLLPRYPAALPHSGGSFEVSLEKFSPKAIQTFMRIERPASDSAPPQDDGFETIGQFYEAVKDGIVRLASQMGEETLFCGDPKRQVTAAQYYGGSGRVLAVSNVDSALAALGEIVEQGEGLEHQQVWDGDRSMFHRDRDEVAHYFRFVEIAEGRRFQPGDTPKTGPTGERFSVDWGAVHQVRANPRSTDHPPGSEVRLAMDRFNHSYCAVLHLLEEAFNGSPALLAVATGEMYALKQQALELMELPYGEGDEVASPSFEYVASAERERSQGHRRIAVVRDGPYLVYGNVPLVRKRKLVSAEDDSISWVRTEQLDTEETYALCRCGMSAAKPFCDGSHARFGFDGTESADPRPTRDRQRVLDGHGIVVRRDGSLCMHAAFCVGRVRRVPAMLEGAEDSDIRAQVIGIIDRCPSGSYTYSLTEDGPDVEADLPVQIAVTEEERGLAGALWVTGQVPVSRADGDFFETRNRVTLCRCGHSENKPLCDGTHRQIEFRETDVPGGGQSA
jgi:CDGSH-type Zn-finger protein